MSQVSALPSSSSYINDHTPGHSNSKPPDSATDPAELLRRAALSSRKLKRRKLDASASVASLSRPLSRRSIASTHSISLDYGQEEPSSTPTTSQPPPAAAPARAPTPTVSHRLGSPDRDVQRGGSAGAAPQTPLVDDASTREEGEISDDEDPPFRLPSKQIPAPVTAAGAAYADMKPEASGSVRSPPFGVASRSPSVRVEDSYQRANLLGSVTTPVRLPSIEAQPAALNSPSESITLETPDYVLDPDHVRPGLSLTQKQYDTVKEVILDILGYGVPPEYLVDCGISKEMIYYVFTELNLRLPSNLVTRGIHPYPPPLDVIESILRSQSGYPLSPSATVDSNAEGDTARPASVGHRNPSPCPPAPHESAATGVPQVAMTSTDGSLSASVLALSESTLTAIERQRKQELLARKAVQASRKRKEILPLSIARDSAASTNAASPGADVSAMSSASAVSVEDFFKSIELPLSGDFRDPDGAPGFPKHSSPEPMRVDEVIPGFGRSVVSEHAQPLPSVTKATAHRPSEDTSLPRSTSVEEFVEREKELPTHEATHALKDLPTRPRGDGTPATHLTREIEREPRRSSTTPQPTAPVPRRGAKRPVAADFDSEPMPKTYTPPVPSRASSDMGFGNGAGHHLNPHVRRKINGAMAGGFASLNSARRCVIDVSDSEDDTSEEETGSTAEAPRGPGPQGGESGGGPSSAGDSALALELEIERMRKMIREREETKLRKQAV
ncbi:hypothetical protein F5148DRAFT_1281799 [Russula earlei]|uniref:Uncharacterized protein n=1 Tax=Russula earlei TaxID=71964 RepID=A0ACC0UH75_9AGAM|nr:hypothetical protein F5148DRAFT_1281799 [Russula earlei]